MTNVGDNICNIPTKPEQFADHAIDKRTPGVNGTCLFRRGIGVGLILAPLSLLWRFVVLWWRRVGNTYSTQLDTAWVRKPSGPSV